MLKKSIVMFAVFSVISVISVFSVQAEAAVLKSWIFKNGKDVRSTANWCPGRKIKFEKSFAADEKVNGLQGTLALKIISKDTKAGPASLQLGFLHKIKLESDAKYKISFYAKSSIEGEILAVAIMNTKPWSSLGRTAKLKSKVSSEWEKYEFEFSSRYDYDKAARVPCIFLGGLPVGAIFMIQDVKFEKID